MVLIKAFVSPAYTNWPFNYDLLTVTIFKNPYTYSNMGMLSIICLLAQIKHTPFIILILHSNIFLYFHNNLSK